MAINVRVNPGRRKRHEALLESPRATTIKPRTAARTIVQGQLSVSPVASSRKWVKSRGGGRGDWNGDGVFSSSGIARPSLSTQKRLRHRDRSGLSCPKLRTACRGVDIRISPRQFGELSENRRSPRRPLRESRPPVTAFGFPPGSFFEKRATIPDIFRSLT